jgi:RNA polymerase sigma-70 factor (ECF subfamily)
VRRSATDAGSQRDAELSEALEGHRPYLLRYAMFHLHDPSLAEDAVQETLLAALRASDRYAGQAQFRTWLTAILKHKIVDLVRRERRYVPIGDGDAQDDAADAVDPFTASGRWSERPGPWVLPEAALESAQFWRVYEKCCGAMPRRHALVFSMREVMGMGAQEICKEMGISASNLHVILFRARLRLRACMSRHWLEADHA